MQSQKPSLRTLIGLTSASLMLSLTLSGCGSTLPQKETPVDPPSAYTEQIPEPTTPTAPVTNGALVEYIGKLRQALREANANLAAIRSWSDPLGQ